MRLLLYSIISRQFSGRKSFIYRCCRHDNRKITHNKQRLFSTEVVKAVGNLVKESQNILLVCGAGISTPSGIPDFRSSGTGLYDNLSAYELDSPTDVFDLSFFHINPYPFFQLAKSLYPGNYQPNTVHHFLKLLSVKKKLLRVYTQNIDMLESAANLPDDEVVYAHGSFATATCTVCREAYDGNQIRSDIMNDVLPICRKEHCQGIIKPDIVFFGEDLPRRFHTLHTNDTQLCDLLLVLGTSLEVFPVASLVYQVRRHTSRVLFNNECVDPFRGDSQTRPKDLVASGDLLVNIQLLMKELNWEEDFERLL